MKHIIYTLVASLLVTLSVSAETPIEATITQLEKHSISARLIGEVFGGGGDEIAALNFKIRGESFSEAARMIRENAAEIEQETNDLLALIEQLESDLSDCVALADDTSSSAEASTTILQASADSLRSSNASLEADNQRLVLTVNQLRAANASLTSQILDLLDENE